MDKATDYLAQEYLFLQNTIEQFDARALTIKAWSVTFSAAGLGLAYEQDNPSLLLVAAGSAIIFWLIDAVWKFHQRAFFPRVIAIEEWFRNASPDVTPFQISTGWKTEFAETAADRTYTRSGSRWKRYAVPFFPGVMLPHVVVASVGLLLYFLTPPSLGA